MSTDVSVLPPSVLLRRLALGLCVLVAVVFLAGLMLREPLELVAEAFVSRMGPAGILVATAIVDSIPGLTHEPVLLLGYSGGLGFWTVIAMGSIGSVLAGPIGFTVGRGLKRSPWVRRMLIRYGVTPFLARYGAQAVAVAAITPFPFAVATWGAGAAGMPFKALMIGSLFRIPKVLFYFSLIAGSWSLGG